MIHTKKTMVNIAITAIFLFTINTLAVPLENWRTSFFRIASEYDNYRSSPSGLFWDDLNHKYKGLFSDNLWPDSIDYSKNHWILEPSVSFEVSNNEFIGAKKYNFHLDGLSDFKYGPLKVRLALDVDQQYSKMNYNEYPYHKDRKLAGLIEEAYLQYTGKYGFFRLGRLKRNWGPFQDRSILLSNNTFAFDAFEWAFQVPFLEFRHLFTAFPSYYSDIDTDVETDNNRVFLQRYFSAHSLNFILGKWGAFGVSETVIFGRDDGFPDLQYINPFSIYSVLNTNWEGYANLMLSFQGWFHPFTEKITIKGQIVFDDFQVDNEDVQDQEPTHWAGDFGFYWSDPSPLPLKHLFKLEYRYVSKWIYTVTDNNTRNGERYTYLGKSLGTEEIDGDKILGEISVFGDNFWGASIGLSVARKDTNDLMTSWRRDDYIGLGYRKETPLSERAELKTTLSNYFKVIAYFKDYANLEFIFENRWIKERSLGNKYEYDPYLSLKLAGHFSGLAVKFKEREK